MRCRRIYDEQAEYLADQIKYRFCFGENRKLKTRGYGNATLSRLPFGTIKNYDLTHGTRERRGILRSDIRVTGQTIHLFNVHLGTAFLERRYQGRELLSERVLAQLGLTGPRIIVGDFNEWTRGLCTQLMSAQFATGDLTRFGGVRGLIQDFFRC